jgi:predicted 3-demethylubiquinone-9 3-methyltransferase (glyoxalase superfamily)
MATLSKITPCLWFDTEAEDAANFYTGIFKNSRVVKVTHCGSVGPRPEGMVMTVDFELDGQPFVGLNGGPEFTFDEAISFQVNCEDQAEVDRFWDALLDGGQEHVCGWLKDRFGLSWQIIPTAALDLVTDPDPARSQRAMKAMMAMKKLDLAELQRAADGA